MSPDGNPLAWYEGPVEDPRRLAERLSGTPGVVEHGLFAPSLVSEVLIAGGGAGAGSGCGAARGPSRLCEETSPRQRAETSGLSSSPEETGWRARTPSEPMTYAPMRASGGE